MQITIEDLSKALGHRYLETTQIYGKITRNKTEKDYQSVVPIETVSKTLGHTNLKTTQIYEKFTRDKTEKDYQFASFPRK